MCSSDLTHSDSHTHTHTHKHTNTRTHTHTTSLIPNGWVRARLKRGLSSYWTALRSGGLWVCGLLLTVQTVSVRCVSPITGTICKPRETSMHGLVISRIHLQFSAATGGLLPGDICVLKTPKYKYGHTASTKPH